jgi:hypothetical protein
VGDVEVGPLELLLSNSSGIGAGFWLLCIPQRWAILLGVLDEHGVYADALLGCGYVEGEGSGEYREDMWE